MSAIQLFDLNGEQRFTGTSVGGGGSQPHTQEALRGNNVSVNNGANGELTWDVSSGPDSLLDLSVPGLPTVKATGTYVVAVEVIGTAMTANGFFDATLSFDWSSPTLTPSVSQLSTKAQVGGNIYLTLTAAWYLAAGAQLEVNVDNFDGVAARNFRIASAIVQRVA